MNLVEQLGGYEKAKAELKDKRWRKDNLHGSSEFTWHMEQHIKLLEAVLLQYRRQHNIYEVGDVITHTDFKCVGRFSKYTGKTGTLCYIDFGLGELTVLIKHIRHATPEEIKAGRKL